MIAANIVSDTRTQGTLGFVFDPAPEVHALILSDRVLFDWLNIEHLELEVPRVPDASGTENGADLPLERFQRRRTHVRAASLRIAPAGLHAYVNALQPRLHEAGLADMKVHCRDGFLSLAARVTEGKNKADATCRIYLAATGLDMLVLVDRPRVYGYLPSPMPLIAHRLCAGFLDVAAADAERTRAAGSYYPRTVGLGQFTLAPLHALLWNTMPPAGWRLPATSNVRLTRIRVSSRGIDLSYGSSSESDADSDRAHADAASRSSDDIIALRAANEQLAEANDILLAGQIDDALFAYRGELAAGGPDQPHVIERILGVEAAHPAYFTEAADFARQILSREPEHATAHTVLANLALVQGDAPSAGTHYRQLAELTRDDDDNAVRAALAGARVLRTTQPELSTALYERVLEYLPTEPEASAALRERYTAEKRFPELGELLRASIDAEFELRNRVPLYLHLAEVLGQRLGDTDGAVVELTKAQALAPDNIAVLRALASRHETDGRLAAAIDTLEQIAVCAAAQGDERAEMYALLRTARLHQRLERDERAETLYLRVLERDERNTSALAGAAELALKRGDHAGAVAMWRRVIDLGQHAPRVASRYHLELGRALLAAGDLADAMTALTHATETGTGDIAGEAHSLLADLHRQASDSARALQELDAAVLALTRAAETIFSQTTVESPPGQTNPPRIADAPDTAPGAASFDDGNPWPTPTDSADDTDGKTYLGRAAKLALKRAELLAEMDRPEDARGDYERAHSLARDAHPEHARHAAQALLDTAIKNGETDAQRKWIDTLLASRLEPDQRVHLLIARARLRAAADDTDAALTDIRTALAEVADETQRATALDLQATLLETTGDLKGRASIIADRARRADTPTERIVGEAEAAAAWLLANDASEAQAAADRTLEHLQQADAADIEISPALRRRALEIVGDIAWRRRLWQRLDETYAQLRALAPIADPDPDPDAHADPDPDAHAHAHAMYAYRHGMALDALGQPERAIASLTQALDVLPNDSRSNLRADAARALGKSYERANRWLDAAHVFESLAADDALEVDDDLRAEAWFRAGDMYERTTEHLDDARRCLNAALIVNPIHMPTLDALERIESASGHIERVAFILEQKIDAGGHNSRRKALLLRLAGLQREQLKRPDLANASYARALDLDPDFRPALRFIAADELNAGNLQAAAHAYERLSRELIGDAALPDEPDELLQERIDSAQTLALIAEQGSQLPIGDNLIASAALAIDKLLDAVPDHPALLDSMTALSQIGVDDTPETPGETPDETPGEPPDEPPDETPDEPETRHAQPAGTRETELAAAREHADAAAERGDYIACAKHLEALVAALDHDSLTTRSRQRSRRASIYLELADLYYDHLGDRARARAAMMAAAEAYGAGSRRDATLRMLAAEAAADGADEAAVDAYERIDGSRQSAADRYNLAASYQRLGRDHRTVFVLERAQESGHLTHQATHLLFQARQEIGSKHERAQILEARARSAPPERAVEFLQEIVELYEKSLGDADSAQRTRTLLERARAGQPLKPVLAREKPAPAPDLSAAQPPGQSIIGKLKLQRVTPEQRLAATRTTPGLGLQSVWKKRAADRTTERDPLGQVSANAPRPSTPGSRLAQLADAALHAGDQAHAAEQLSRAIVLRAEKLASESHPLDETTRSAIVRLRSIAEQADAYDPLVRALTSAAKIEPDPATASAAWTEIAALYRQKLGSRARSADALMHAIMVNPGDSALLRQADELFGQLADHPRLVDVYEMHIDTLKGTERAHRLLELARLHREELEDHDAANECVTRAHDADPGVPEVLLSLAEIRAAAGENDRAIELYDRLLARGHSDPETLDEIQRRIAELNASRLNASQDALAAALDDRDPAATAQPFGEPSSAEFMGQGALLESRGQWRGAIAAYESAAAKRPHDLLPLEAIARVYSDLGEGEALLAVIDRLLERTNDTHMRARLYFRQSQVARDMLRKNADSYQYLQTAHETDPSDPDISYSLRVTSMARGEWNIAADMVMQEIARVSDPREAGALHLELALIYDEKLLDAKRARDSYERALELDPEIPAAPRPLARLYELEGRFRDAALMHERAAYALRSTSQRAQLLQRAAESAELAGSIVDARRLYRSAVEAASTDDSLRTSASSALARLDRSAGRAMTNGSLVNQRREQIEHVRRQLEQATRDRDRALTDQLAHELIALDPTDATAYAVLEAHASADGDWLSLSTLLQTRAKALIDADEKAAAYYDLGNLNQLRLHDDSAAIDAYENALRAQPAHPLALEALAGLAYDRRDWARARELYARLAPEKSSLSADTLAYRRGVIAEGLGDDHEALEAFSHAAELAPGSPEILASMARVALRTGSLDAAIRAAHAQLELLPLHDVNAITDARLELARLYAKAGDNEQAVHYNELVIAENPRHQSALRSLYRLYLERRKFEDAARTLSTLISMTHLLPRRAELLYTQGELYRTHLMDFDRAADAYLKSIDLDPDHVPTLRRLIDYYWREDEPEELLDIVTVLMNQGSLLDADTENQLLVRALLTAATQRGQPTSDADDNKASLLGPIADYLGTDLSSALIDVLIETTAWEGEGPPIQALAEAVFFVIESRPDIDVPHLLEQLETRGAADTTPKLIAALRTMHAFRQRAR